MKLIHRALESDLSPNRLGKMDWDKPTFAPPRPRLDHEVGERTCDRINNYSADFSARPVTAHDFASNAELRSSGHQRRLSLWMCAKPRSLSLVEQPPSTCDGPYGKALSGQHRAGQHVTSSRSAFQTQRR